MLMPVLMTLMYPAGKGQMLIPAFRHSQMHMTIMVAVTYHAINSARHKDDSALGSAGGAASV